MAIVLHCVVYCPPCGATHLQPGLAVELCHSIANGIVDDKDFSRAVGVPLRFVTRDIVEVIVIGEVKEQVVNAFRLDCNRKDALMKSRVAAVPVMTSTLAIKGRVPWLLHSIDRPVICNRKSAV